MSTRERVAASASNQPLGATGAKGDFLDFLLVIPATTSPGAVALIDGDSSYTLFEGGASSVSNLVPFPIPIEQGSKDGPWKLTLGSNVSVVAFGNFRD
jgi:hypothetical protein